MDYKKKYLKYKLKYLKEKQKLLKGGVPDLISGKSKPMHERHSSKSAPSKPPPSKYKIPANIVVHDYSTYYTPDNIIKSLNREYTTDISNFYSSPILYVEHTILLEENDAKDTYRTEWVDFLKILYKSDKNFEGKDLSDKNITYYELFKKNLSEVERFHKIMYKEDLKFKNYIIFISKIYEPKLPNILQYEYNQEKSRAMHKYKKGIDRAYYIMDKNKKILDKWEKYIQELKKLNIILYNDTELEKFKLLDIQKQEIEQITKKLELLYKYDEIVRVGYNSKHSESDRKLWDQISSYIQHFGTIPGNIINTGGLKSENKETFNNTEWTSPYSYEILMHKHNTDIENYEKNRVKLRFFADRYHTRPIMEFLRDFCENMRLGLSDEDGTKKVYKGLELRILKNIINDFARYILLAEHNTDTSTDDKSEGIDQYYKRIDYNRAIDRGETTENKKMPMDIHDENIDDTKDKMNKELIPNYKMSMLVLYNKYVKEEPLLFGQNVNSVVKKSDNPHKKLLQTLEDFKEVEKENMLSNKNNPYDRLIFEIIRRFMFLFENLMLFIREKNKKLLDQNKKFYKIWGPDARADKNIKTELNKDVKNIRDIVYGKNQDLDIESFQYIFNYLYNFQFSRHDSYKKLEFFPNDDYYHKKGGNFGFEMDYYKFELNARKSICEEVFGAKHIKKMWGKDECTLRNEGSPYREKDLDNEVNNIKELLKG